MLNGLVVAITGGAGLIGSAFSRAIIQNGGKVIIGDVAEDRGRSLENELGAESAKFLPVNTSEPDSIDQFLNNGVAHFGRIDAAVHCAYPRSKQWGTKFEDLQPEGLADDLYHQLGGAILFSQKVVALFKKQGSGNLVHISSIQGEFAPKFEHYEGTKMVSPIEYSAIKSGIISITRYLAKYCKGHGIRVNSISPGGILDNQPETFLKKYRASCNIKGMMDANDLSGTLIYLLSEQSMYLSGQNIILDDGWSL
jgi:NAD(P)-dependent dehydrogenase (short-subunit alcohol dehydrogenase family)